MPKLESGEVRLAVGDELRLKFSGGGLHGVSQYSGTSWEGDGNVVKIPNSEQSNGLVWFQSESLRSFAPCIDVSDEIALELRRADGVPSDCSTGFSVDYVWKSTSFDRMQSAMKTFALDERSVSGYIVS